jgi:hypothetical protein
MVSLAVNGRSETIDAPADKPLLAANYGCGIAEYGAPAACSRKVGRPHPERSSSAMSRVNPW